MAAAVAALGEIARAEATSVIILSPVLALTGPSPSLYPLGQADMLGQVGQKDQPGIGHQAVVVEGDTDAVVAWQHLLDVPGLGLVFCFKTIIPDA